MDLLQESAFWWALVASVWAVTSDWLGSQPQIKQNAVYQVLLTMIGNAIRGQAQKSGRDRRRGRRG